MSGKTVYQCDNDGWYLHETICAPEWALMFEVGDATGARQRRWADAVAMNLYPSRGLEIHGFEVKAHRSDWLRELKNPAKAESVQRYCDRWWIAAPPGIVQAGELPPTWGLYEAKNGKLTQVIAAPKLEPEPVNRAFVAAMLRRASEADEDLVRAAVDAEVTRQRENDQKYIQQQIDWRTRQYKEVEERIAKIKAISGVDLTHWCDDEEIGRAIKLVLDAGVVKTYGGIQEVRNSAARILKDCDEALAAFPPPASDEAA